jgi:hypothetical protein
MWLEGVDESVTTSDEVGALAVLACNINATAQKEEAIEDFLTHSLHLVAANSCHRGKANLEHRLQFSPKATERAIHISCCRDGDLK